MGSVPLGFQGAGDWGPPCSLHSTPFCNEKVYHCYSVPGRPTICVLEINLFSSFPAPESEKNFPQDQPHPESGRCPIRRM